MASFFSRQPENRSGSQIVCYLTHTNLYFSGIKRTGVTLNTHLHVILQFNEVKKVSITVGCSSSHLTLRKYGAPEDKSILGHYSLSTGKQVRKFLEECNTSIFCVKQPRKFFIMQYSLFSSNFSLRSKYFQHPIPKHP